MKTTRKTVSKTAILELITLSEVALSQIEIQKTLNGLCDRVTIYRVLDRLVNEDLIHKIATPDGTLKYASCKHQHDNQFQSHQHIHFNCEKCLAVTCLENIAPVFKIPANYKVIEMNFTLTGICPKCN
jgi:Fur family ferric uptake transcriptional regulator